MRRPRARFSAFQSGSRRQRLSAGDLSRYRFELVPMTDVVRSDEYSEVAERLVSIVGSSASVQRWLPGVAERYSTVESAKDAMKRASARKDMIAWMIRQVSVDPLNIQIDPSETYGIATMSEGVPVRDAQGRIGHYILASFWAEEPPVSFGRTAIAHSLLYDVPASVLREKSRRRVFASIEGPQPGMGNETDIPLDPSIEFWSVGELWEGAVQLEGSKLQTADGIVTTEHTRLYRPKHV